MDIVIIGSGNVATVLGRKFKAAGHQIIQVYSRNASEASALAYEWDTESTNYKILINKTAQIYIIAVSDDAIDDVTDNLRLPGKVVAHTAASVPKEILKNVTSHYGVFYPLQSLRKETPHLPEIPIFFDGHDAVATTKLEALAHSIAGEMVVHAGDDERLKLHVAAVIVSNFPNYLYSLGEQYCKKEGLDFRQLIPLIQETASRINDLSPQQAQTGPAVRHDTATINKHLQLLEAHPELQKLYAFLSKSIEGTTGLAPVL